jgi:hypothetical protein
MLFYELEKYYGASMVIEPEAVSDKESAGTLQLTGIISFF